jgi:hypothetical protein
MRIPQTRKTAQRTLAISKICGNLCIAGRTVRQAESVASKAAGAVFNNPKPTSGVTQMAKAKAKKPAKKVAKKPAKKAAKK